MFDMQPSATMICMQGSSDGEFEETGGGGGVGGKMPHK